LGTNRVPAISKSLELYELRQQCRGDIRLALYRVYRVIFAAHARERRGFVPIWQYPSLDFWQHVSFNVLRA
jgi:hypothetical protein